MSNTRIASMQELYTREGFACEDSWESKHPVDIDIRMTGCSEMIKRCQGCPVRYSPHLRESSIGKCLYSERNTSKSELSVGNSFCKGYVFRIALYRDLSIWIYKRTRKFSQYPGKHRDIEHTRSPSPKIESCYWALLGYIRVMCTHSLCNLSNQKSSIYRDLGICWSWIKSKSTVGTALTAKRDVDIVKHFMSIELPHFLQK
jgi:hypothetical protein